MLTRLRRFFHGAHPETGQGLVEYALILILVAVVVIGALATTGPAIADVYSTIIVALNDKPTFADLEAAVESCVTHPGAKNPLLNTIAAEDLDGFKSTLETKKNKISGSCYSTLKSLADRM